MTKLIALAVAAFIAAPLAASAGQSWTWTGPRGGTSAGSGSCAAGGGAVSCDWTSTVTGPEGRAFDRTGHRVATRDRVVTDITTRGPKGGITRTHRERTRP